MDFSASPHEFRAETRPGSAARSVGGHRGGHRGGPLPSAGRGDAVPRAARGLGEVNAGGGKGTKTVLRNAANRPDECVQNREA